MAKADEALRAELPLLKEEQREDKISQQIGA
jgi:hypothetical protein